MIARHRATWHWLHLGELQKLRMYAAILQTSYKTCNMVFGSKSRSTRTAGPSATTTTTPPAPARSRWLKGHHARNEEKHVEDLKVSMIYRINF
jgi:hypothetical protein